MRVEIKDKTLRKRVLGAMVKTGLAGPPYSLDDINPFVSFSHSNLYIDISFWDMKIIFHRFDDPSLYGDLEEYIKENKE